MTEITHRGDLRIAGAVLADILLPGIRVEIVGVHYDAARDELVLVLALFGPDVPETTDGRLRAVVTIAEDRTRTTQLLPETK